MKRISFFARISAVVLFMWPLTPPAAAPRCQPTSHFVVLPDGVVRDTLTKLLWQRTASTSMKWADAETYCLNAGSGFRLPTVKELESLVDLRVASPGPTIDKTAFPSTPSSCFWTSTPADSLHAFCVHFDDGHLWWPYVTDSYRVRCVR